MTVLEVIQKSTSKSAESTEALADLGLDSLEFVELIKDLETAFSIVIPNSEIASLQTVEDLISLVYRLQTQISFAVEPWISLWRDGHESIFQKHWKELAMDQDKIELALDFDTYVQLDIQGKLHIVTARNDGQLVGYVIMFLMIHPHYKTAGVMALADVYYVLPEFRGVTGAQLLTEVERTLKERGVKKAYLSCKIHQDHSRLFSALGWKPTDITFSKYLG